jgi:hypothetical protein
MTRLFVPRPASRFGETNPPGKIGRTKPTPSRAYFESRAKRVRRKRLAETEPAASPLWLSTHV